MRRSGIERPGLAFGFVKDGEGGATCVPTVEFDFESLFRRTDGDPEEDEETGEAPQLTELLSPRELIHAYAVVRRILKKSSPYSRATRATWRDPVMRERRVAGLRRAAKDPEVRRKRSASLRRWWQGQDRERIRAQARMMWRERRAEIMEKLCAALREPEYRQGVSRRTRAMWADPVKRERMLATCRSPAARRRAAHGTRSYFARHPEARKRAAEKQRAVWRDPDYRRRRNRTLAGRKAAWLLLEIDESSRN